MNYNHPYKWIVYLKLFPWFNLSNVVVAKNKTYKSFDADFSSRLVNSASKLDLSQEGNIKVKDLVSHTFPLTQFEKAYETYTGRLDGAMKVVVLPNPDDIGDMDA